jgi:hypothetical protein
MYVDALVRYRIIKTAVCSLVIFEYQTFFIYSAESFSVVFRLNNRKH